MSMDSTSLLPAVRQLPTTPELSGASTDELLTRIRRMDRGHFAVDVSIGAEEAMEALFQARNVPDIISEAHPLAFRRIANDGVSLYEHYEDVAERGTLALTNFINPLKGKVAELRAEDLLEEQNPGWDFSLAESAT